MAQIISKKIKKEIPIEENIIKINSEGVYTGDKRGNRYYRGRLQTRLNMTCAYFDEAKRFWATQTLNGEPMNLQEVQVIVAANSAIPYNSILQTRSTPRLAERDESNKVGWYNIKFENGETGWVCNVLYPSVGSASICAAVDTVHKIYNDKKVIACIRSIMEKQK